MVLKLLPCLSGKLGHVLVPTELKLLGKLSKRIHMGWLAVKVEYSVNKPGGQVRSSGSLMAICFTLACRSISARSIF